MVPKEQHKRRKNRWSQTKTERMKDGGATEQEMGQKAQKGERSGARAKAKKGGSDPNRTVAQQWMKSRKLQHEKTTDGNVEGDPGREKEQ